MNENEKAQNSREKDLFAQLRQAYEPDSASLERVKARVFDERSAYPASDASRSGAWPLGWVMAAALSILVTLGVWQIPTATPSSPAPTAEKPALVISNESGFVTVRAGANQWIVLPGDTP